MINGKVKGNVFENWTCKGLSKWLTGTSDTTQLIPSRLSGGWKDAAARHAGDLAANGPTGEEFRQRFVVECKHRKTDIWWHLLNTPGENIQGWWAKLCGEAEPFKLQPMLVVRQNFKPVMVGLHPELARCVAFGAYDPTPVIEYWCKMKNGDVVCCGLVQWETLVSWDAERFYELTERLFE